MKCSDCRYFAIYPDLARGDCMYAPPKAVVIGSPRGTEVHSYRPVMDRNAWCAQFSSKEPVENYPGKIVELDR